MVPSYSTYSIHMPRMGTVQITSPSLSVNIIFVLPAPYSPTIMILVGALFQNFENRYPILFISGQILQEIWLNINITYYFLFVIVRASQSKPSYRPSPVVAMVLWMYQFRPRSVFSPSLPQISAVVIECGRSCLLANTRSSQ